MINKNSVIIIERGEENKMAKSDDEKKEYQRRYYQERVKGNPEKRAKRNELQREYSRRVGYAASAKYNKERGTSVAFRLFSPQDDDILEKLKSVDSKAGYIKELIRADIQKS